MVKNKVLAHQGIRRGAGPLPVEPANLSGYPVGSSSPGRDSVDALRSAALLQSVQPLESDSARSSSTTRAATSTNRTLEVIAQAHFDQAGVRKVAVVKRSAVLRTLLSDGSDHAKNPTDVGSDL